MSVMNPPLIFMYEYLPSDEAPPEAKPTHGSSRRKIAKKQRGNAHESGRKRDDEKEVVGVVAAKREINKIK